MGDFKKLITPFGKTSDRQESFIMIGWVAFLVILFQLYHSPIVPAPLDIVKQLLEMIQSRDFIDDFLTSLVLTVKAMLYSILITMFLVYLSRVPLFKVFAQMASKCRYLTLTGIVFLFTVMSNNLENLKMSLLLFGIVPYFVTSFLSIVEEKEVQQQLNKCYTNRKNAWESLFEVIIVGKMDKLFEVMRQNFAISWMMITTVEGYNMSGGGIGTMMIKSNKQLQLASVFAVLLTVLCIGVLFDWGLRRLRFMLFEYLKSNKR